MVWRGGVALGATPPPPHISTMLPDITHSQFLVLEKQDDPNADRLPKRLTLRQSYTCSSFGDLRV